MCGNVPHRNQDYSLLILLAYSLLAISRDGRRRSSPGKAETSQAHSAGSFPSTAPSNPLNDRAQTVDRTMLVRCRMTRPSNSALLPTIATAAPRTHQGSRCPFRGARQLRFQIAAGRAGSGSHGLLTRAAVMASSAVRPWAVAERKCQDLWTKIF